MSSNKFGCGCWSFLGIISVSLIGGWYIHSSGWLGKELTPLEGAKVIPKEAIVTSFISAEPQNWSHLQQLGLPETERLIEKNIANLQQEFSDSTEVDYQEDLQPWIGGLMIALLPEQSSTQKGGNVLIVIGIKNKLKALTFIKNVHNKNKEDWQERKYQGITITEVKNKNERIISSSLLGNKLVISNDRQTLEKAIDAYKEKTSLASKSSAKEVLSQKLTIKNPVAQVYFTDFNYLIEQMAKEDISAATLAELQQLESVIMGIGLQKEGLHLQSITNLKIESNNSNFSATDNKILAKLPTNSIAALNGQNLNQIWSTAIKPIEADKDLRRVLDMGRLSFRYGTGLDLDEDFFSWMDGEFAFSLITTKNKIIPGLGIGLESLIILETSNPQKAKATLAQLEKSLQSHVGIYSQQKKIANKQTITEWLLPRSNFPLAYGWVDKNCLVFTIGKSGFEFINNSAGNSLERSDEFQAIARKLPNNNFGYFYLDMNQIVPIINRLPADSTDISPEAMSVLNSLVGIGATATMPDKSTSQLDVLILFK